MAEHTMPDDRKVAVLIPVHNDDGRLSATLRSIDRQGVPLIAVVVDDGSAPPLSIDERELDFPVVLLRLTRNQGIERALNAGLAAIRARGIPFVARLDNGDRCMPGRLAAQRAHLDAHPEVALVGSAVEWRDDSGRLRFARRFPAEHAAIVRALHHSVALVHPAVMFRTSVVDIVGDYSTRYPAAEDYEFLWRIACRFQVSNLPDTLLVTRFDPDGITMRRRRRQLVSALRVRLAHFRPLVLASYLGVLKALVLLAVPYSWIVRIKAHATRTDAETIAGATP